MKKLNVIKIGLTCLSTIVCCLVLSACAKTQQTTVEEVTTTGENCIETHVRKVKGKNGRLKVEEQSFYEKVRCVGKMSGPMHGSEAHFVNLNITGSIEADKITCDTLNVIGPATLKYFSIKKNAEIEGPLISQNGTLQDVTVMSSASLTDTTVKNIMIKHNNAYDQETKKDILELKGKTIVTGDITFASGKGEVVIEGNDVSIGGKIKGGIIKTKAKL